MITGAESFVFGKTNAKKLYEAHVWDQLTNRQLVLLQLFAEEAFTPLDVYLTALEDVFGRSIIPARDLTVFGAANLRREFYMLWNNFDPNFDGLHWDIERMKKVVFSILL